MAVMILNTAILTDYGTYRFYPISVEEARRIVRERGYESAVGHAATAEILSEVLGMPVEARRITYQQARGEVALVFRLLERIPGGKVLSRAEIEAIGFEFGLLERLE